MTSRDTILQAVRRNEPKNKVPMPEIPLLPGYDENSIGLFRSNLERMGGRWFELTSGADVQAKFSELFPEAKNVCTAVTEVEGTRHVVQVTDPRQLHDVDVGIVRGQFGVAETGSVWVTDSDLVINALGFLPQHLVVLLDPCELVGSMHDAYARIDLGNTPYGCFMTGPSATADIEGVLIHGAQGVRSLTVLLIPQA